MPGLLTVGVPYVAEAFVPRIGARAMGYYVSALVVGGLIGRLGVALASAVVGWRVAIGVLAAVPPRRRDRDAERPARAGPAAPRRRHRAPPPQPPPDRRLDLRRSALLHVRRHVHLRHLPARGAAVLVLGRRLQPHLPALADGRVRAADGPARRAGRLAARRARHRAPLRLRRAPDAAECAAAARARPRVRRVGDVRGRDGGAARDQRRGAGRPRSRDGPLLQHLLQPRRARGLRPGRRVAGVGLARGRRHRPRSRSPSPSPGWRQPSPAARSRPLPQTADARQRRPTTRDTASSRPGADRRSRSARTGTASGAAPSRRGAPAPPRGRRRSSCSRGSSRGSRRRSA